MSKLHNFFFKFFVFQDIFATEVSVYLPSGDVFAASVPADATVGSLKKMLSRKKNLPVSFFCLFTQGIEEVLPDGALVCDFSPFFFLLIGDTYSEETDNKCLEKIFSQNGGRFWLNSSSWVNKTGTYDGVTRKDVTHGRVIKLYLGFNNLSGFFSKEFTCLTSLKELSLSNNRLRGNLPEEISQLFLLTHLFLNSNYFTGEIPSSLGDLKRLEYLDLSGNLFLGELPKELGQMISLKQLYLENNSLTGRVPIDFCYLVNLEYLNLSGNVLTGFFPEEAIFSLTKLKQLMLTQHYLKGEVPDFMSWLLKYIKCPERQLELSFHNESLLEQRGCEVFFIKTK